MSDIYVQGLRGVQTEFNAAKEGVTYVEQHWQRQAIYLEVPLLSPRGFAQTSRRLEQTYFIRLFAEFEGILKDHLASNHPSAVVSSKSTVDWLIRHTIRNTVAHSGRNPAPAITLAAALSTLDTFLARLPEPLT